MNRGTVYINYTIGFGNNIFQYCMGRLLAETHGMSLAHHSPDLEKIGVAATEIPLRNDLPVYVVDDNNYKKYLMTQMPECNFVVRGYFEDYKILKPHLGEIRDWFSKVKITNKSDVILHMRLQNRLVQESHHKNHISADSFKRALEQFEYDRLHIVTDAEKWGGYTREDIEKIQHEIATGPNPPQNSPWAPTEQSIEYANHIMDGLSDLNPIVHCNGASTLPGSGGLRADFIDDFNLTRSFNQVIIFNSTFSWWAATLSGAEKVAIFSPWKIAKAPKDRRNLGDTSYPGWFSWGSADDLYFKKYGVKQ